MLLPILENDPAVQAVTLLRHLQMTDPEASRTIVSGARWSAACGTGALHGAAKDVIFRQATEPGRMGLSDFTDGEADQRAFQWKDRPTNGLGVTIAGQPSAHRLYHFVLGYSGWEHVGIVQGGESFTALAENLRDTRSGRWAASRTSSAPKASLRRVGTSTARPRRT